MLVKKRPVHRKVKRVHKEIEIANSYIPSTSTQSTRKTSPLQVESSLIDDVKEDSASVMISSLFNSSLYPDTDDIDILADTALDDAIAKHKNNGIHLSSSHSFCDSCRT
jgi:hypothetical protein